MADFYPSAVVNLTVRFDETLKVNVQPDSATDSSNVSTDDLTDTPAVEESEPGDERAGDEVQDVNARTQAALEPLVLPKDALSRIVARMPISGSWELPGIRQAGKFNLTFDFRDLPVDPRTVRAIGVEIHQGAVPSSDYARGMIGQQTANGQLLSILRQDSSGLGFLLNESTLLFSGAADTMAVHHTDRQSKVMIQGRDVRGILMDAKIPVKKVAKIKLSNPLHTVIADIIKTITRDESFQLDISMDEREWPDGKIPSPGDKKGLTRVRQKAAGDAAKSTPPGAGAPSYWDLITQYCSLVGGIPHLVGTVLWIRPAHSIYKRILDESIPTPFRNAAPRPVEGGDQLRVRQLVYGRDLTSLSFERKFNGANVPLIKAVSVDDRKRGRGKLLEVQWPPKGSKAAKLKGDSEVLRVPVPGVIDKDRLKSVAREVYEELGRGEMGGSAETSDLASIGGGNDDPDMLRLRPTDAVELLVDSRALSSNTPLVSELNEHRQRSFEEEVQHLTERIGDETFARVLTAISRGNITRILDFFRVGNVRYTWQVASGMKIAFDFQNYVIARHEEEKDTADEDKPPRVKTKRVKREKV